MAAASSKRVDALTGARACAGLYILSLHFGAPLFAHAPAWAETLRSSGYVATSWFIMLSGFVLTIAYGKKFVDGRMDRRSFVIQRVARVYPVYGLALVVMLPFALSARWGEATATFSHATLRYKLVTFVAQASFSHVWLPSLVTTWNVPGWCVSVEMWFYALFPLVAVWLLARRRRALLALLVGSWAGALALSIGYTVLRPDGFVADRGSYGFYLNLYKFSPLTRWPEFLFGMALGALWLRQPEAARGRRWATPLVAGSVLVGALVLLCARVPYTLLHNGTLMPLYAALVWGLMLGEGPLHRALAWKPLTVVGDASYVLYILQVPLMQWMVLGSGRRYGGGLGAGFTAGALAVTIAVAVAVRRLYELRAQAWLRDRLERWWPRRAAAPAPTLPTVPAISSAAR